MTMVNSGLKGLIMQTNRIIIQNGIPHVNKSTNDYHSHRLMGSGRDDCIFHCLKMFKQIFHYVLILRL